MTFSAFWNDYIHFSVEWRSWVYHDGLICLSIFLDRDASSSILVVNNWSPYVCSKSPRSNPYFPRQAWMAWMVLITDIGCLVRNQAVYQFLTLILWTYPRVTAGVYMLISRGIEWSLRAFTDPLRACEHSVQGVFLCELALLATSTLQKTTCTKNRACVHMQAGSLILRALGNFEDHPCL